MKDTFAVDCCTNALFSEVHFQVQNHAVIYATLFYFHFCLRLYEEHTAITSAVTAVITKFIDSAHNYPQS